MATSSTLCDFGWKAKDFTLKGVDGAMHSLADLKGENGVLIAFICNHCPYVKSAIERFVADAGELAKIGIPTVAICSNDAVAYPQDGFEPMQRFAQGHRFTFPYLHDETQEVARAYDAVCTPDFFGFNADLELQYRGRLDAVRLEAAPAGLRRDLLEAMRQVAESGKGPEEQAASMGCSIKWKAGA